MMRYRDTVLDAAFAAGTRRAAAIDATWRRIAPLARKVGVTRIADHTGLDTIGIPVVAAIRPMARSLSTQHGKGATRDAARVSAVMEAIETFTAEQARRTIRGSARALARRHRVVDVRTLPRARRGRLDRDARWRWVAGWDIVGNAEILVPADCVTLDTTFRRPPVFDMSSNGLASGNVLVEAIAHGVAEVIERDAEAAWRRDGTDRRLVLDAIDDPTCRGLIDRVVGTGARIFVWDLTDGRHVAVIGCAIVEDPDEPAWRSLGVYQGFGAHVVPEIAIARAITEAAQTRVAYIAGGRDDLFRVDYAHATDRELVGELWRRAASPCDEPVDPAELPRAATGSLGGDLAALCAPLPQVIVVDLTLPELGVPVVKVIVPGLATEVAWLG
jgi:ribosomal protein S12 methylthiotransferase accessory factor